MKIFQRPWLSIEHLPIRIEAAATVSRLWIVKPTTLSFLYTTSIDPLNI